MGERQQREVALDDPGMGERQQREVALDDPGVVSFNAEFGDLKLWQGYYHMHPLHKSTPDSEVKNFYDTDSKFLHIPRRQRSTRRAGKKPAVRPTRNSEGCNVEGSGGEYQVVTDQDKPQNVSGKHKKAASDSVVVSKPRISNVRRSTRATANVSDKHKQDAGDPDVICYPPAGNGRKSMRLLRGTGQKSGKLDTENFEIYIENIWRKFAEEKRNAFTYFDSLWFTLYSDGSLREKVLSWIKKKNIFSKKYVFIPIVQWRHWFLLILCNFDEDPESSDNYDRCMLLLDSLGKANSEQLEPAIRKFVFDIFETNERPEDKHLISEIPLLVPKVPQQISGKECGFYVLYYIKLFLDSAPENLTFSTGYPHFLKEDWFTPEDVECFFKTLDSTNKGSSCTN